jgi:hypothetical protein
MGAAQAPPEAAEILRLVITLMVIPPAIYMVKRLPTRTGQTMLVASFLSIAFAHVLAIAEDLVPFRPLVDMVQHLGYGAAGVFAVASAVMMLRASLEARRQA